MKLETTLEDRPGFLHALPVFDLFALVSMLLILGPAFLGQSGISVEVPSSRFQMQRYSNSIVVTVGAGGEAIYLGRQPVSPEQLSEQLSELKQDENMSRAIVLLKTDASTSVGMERMVSERILEAGFELALVGSPKEQEKLENGSVK